MIKIISILFVFASFAPLANAQPMDLMDPRIQGQIQKLWDEDPAWRNDSIRLIKVACSRCRAKIRAGEGNCNGGPLDQDYAIYLHQKKWLLAASVLFARKKSMEMCPDAW